MIIDWTVTPLRDEFYVVGRDVTERRSLEDQLRQSQKMEAVGQLTGGLAHDFNNLLAGVIGNADLLALQLPPSSEMASNIGAIILGAQRAADLVSKMLAYAGERHGSIGLIDLDVLVRELLDLLRASAARHCTLKYIGQPVTIVGDPTQIRQVVMNLIINAAEAVDEGTGVVTVTWTTPVPAGATAVRRHGVEGDGQQGMVVEETITNANDGLAVTGGIPSKAEAGRNVVVVTRNSFDDAQRFFRGCVDVSCGSKERCDFHVVAHTEIQRELAIHAPGILTEECKGQVIKRLIRVADALNVGCGNAEPVRLQAD